ncbi:hypothetical protein F1559_000585 [Cyanidiococcus yangmingshanensis]|uniref:Dymeclin n=1 Tax=Cyanidiococcus yangmingshanensis TaxID=2690220 RepID=A0A7J7IH72_9RHOD|nr:hypothetical protein F1559_000585 [Cyanidiococcus yangmingshanensis]
MLDWLDAVGNTALIRWLHPLTDRCVHLLLHHLIRDTMECIHRQGILETHANVDASAGDALLSRVIYQGLECDFLGLDQAHSMNKLAVSRTRGGDPHRPPETSTETAMPAWLRFWPFSASSPRPEHDGPDSTVSSQSGIQPYMFSPGNNVPANRALKIGSDESVAVVDAFQESSASNNEQGPCLPTDHLTRRTLLWMTILLALLSFPDEESGEMELPRCHDRGVRQPFRQAFAAALEQTTPESPRNVAAHGDRGPQAAHESTLDVLHRREHRHMRSIVLPQLHDVVVWWLFYTEGSYLLYFMTHDSARHWRRYLTARTDPETLLLPLLRMLYLDETNTTAEVLLSTLLMLTDDDGWSLALANRVFEHPILWYREAPLIPGQFTLADIAICILVRFIRRKQKDGPLVSLTIATLSGLAPAAAAAPRPSPPDARVGVPRLFLLFELYWRQWKRYHEQWDDAARTRVLCLLGSVLELLFAVWVAADFEPRQCGVLGDDLINAASHIQQAVRLTGRTCTPMERFFTTLVQMVVATDHDWWGPNREHNAVERPVEALETDASISPSQRFLYASSAPVDGQAPATPESIRDAICSWARHWRRQQSRTMRRLVYRFEEQPGAARARLGPNVWALVARRTGWPVSGALS